MGEQVRVFISYSHETPEQKECVRQFAERLKAVNLDVMLDQWAQPDRGWPFWSEQEVRNADFVLVVCTEKYLRLAESPNEQEFAGRGTWWEIDLMRQEVYDAKGVNRRFIPVLFGATDVGNIPSFLRGVMRYRLDDPDSYIELLARLGARTDGSPGSSTGYMLLPPRTCVNGSELRSVSGELSTSIHFHNRRSGAVRVYWVGYTGERDLRFELEPGESMEQQTFVTHPWVVTTNVGGAERCVAVFEPTSQPGVAEIE